MNANENFPTIEKDNFNNVPINRVWLLIPSVINQ